MGICYRLVILNFIAVGFALILSAGSSQAATLVNCTSSSGALTTFFNGVVSSGTTVSVKGTCVGDVFITNVANPGVTIQQDVSGGEINGSIQVFSSVVNIENITVDGTGGDNRGIAVNAGSPGFTTSTPSAVSLIGVTVQNFPDTGVGGEGGSFLISGGAITGNKNCGIFVHQGVSVQVSGTTISGNGTDPTDTLPGDQCGIHVEAGGQLTLGAAVVESNNGPALWISQGTVTDSGSTLSSPGTVTMPVVVVRRGSYDVSNDTITGTGHSNAIFATPGSAIMMQGTTVTQSDAADATVLVADGSTLLSLGGNHIANNATNGIAVSVTNASTFRQRNESGLLIPLAADTIAGAGSVQIESNMELGTGATPTSWTGAIAVAQNSSLRMDGGITVSSTVKLTQASNGFFNVSNTGENIVTGGVTCPATTNPSSHVAGNTVVLLAHLGASAVTIGNTPPNCLGF